MNSAWYEELCDLLETSKTHQMIESILICAAFVYGVKAVINGYADFFDFDLDNFYAFKNTKFAPHAWRDRPQWQRFILKPTIYCNVCMSSVWGSVYFWAVHYHSANWIVEWPLHMVCSAAIITIINKIPE